MIKIRKRSWRNTYIGDEVEKACRRGAIDSLSCDKQHQHISLDVIGRVSLTKTAKNAQYKQEVLDTLKDWNQEAALLERLTLKREEPLIILIHQHG